MRKQITSQVGLNVVYPRAPDPRNNHSPHAHTQWRAKQRAVFLFGRSGNRSPKSIAVFRILVLKTIQAFCRSFVPCLYRSFSFMNFVISDMFSPVMFDVVSHKTSSVQQSSSSSWHSGLFRPPSFFNVCLGSVFFQLKLQNLFGNSVILFKWFFRLCPLCLYILLVIFSSLLISTFLIWSSLVFNYS
jgi:hypothetical protein